MVADNLDQLRSAYHALGPGFSTEARELFDHPTEADHAAWRLRGSHVRSRLLSATELVTDDLFAVPATWEITRVVPDRMDERGNTVTVTGHMYCRPKGSWETVSLPFMHRWTMCRGRVLNLRSFLDGIELSRADGASRCAA
jgi:hypothetical protein